MSGVKGYAKELSKLEKSKVTFLAGAEQVNGEEGQHAMITNVQRAGRSFKTVQSKIVRPFEYAVCWVSVADDDVLTSYGVQHTSGMCGTKQHAVAKHTNNNRKIKCSVTEQTKSLVLAYYKGKTFKGDNTVPVLCGFRRKVDRYELVIVDKNTFDRGLNIVCVYNSGNCSIEVTVEKGFIED